MIRNSAAVSFDEDMLEDVLREIYNEEVDPAAGEFPKKLFEATREKFEQASAEGFAGSDFDISGETDFLKQYTNSIWVFSAFRSHAYADIMASRLHDSHGELRSFEEWRKATEDIQSHFNRQWLQTEYDTAILRAEQAADWKRFERDADIMPNLRWMPTSSAEPREEHAVFWGEGLTLPIDDPFWDSHRPGDLWNCKCWLEQTDAEPTPEEDLPPESRMPSPSPGLWTNPKSAEMFDRSHPYYPDPEKCILLKNAKRKGRDVECVKNCNVCILTKGGGGR